MDVYSNSIEEENYLEYDYLKDTKASLYSSKEIAFLRNHFCNKLLLFGNRFNPDMAQAQAVFFRYLKNFTFLGRREFICNVTERLFNILTNYPEDKDVCNHLIYKNNLFILNDLFTSYLKNKPKNFDNLKNLTFIIDYEAAYYKQRPISIPRDIIS